MYYIKYKLLKYLFGVLNKTEYCQQPTTHPSTRGEDDLYDA